MKITYKTNKTVTGRDIKTNSVKLQGFLRDGIIFRTTVRFLFGAFYKIAGCLTQER